MLIGWNVDAGDWHQSEYMQNIHQSGNHNAALLKIASNLLPNKCEQPKNLLEILLLKCERAFTVLISPSLHFISTLLQYSIMVMT